MRSISSDEEEIEKAVVFRIGSIEVPIFYSNLCKYSNFIPIKYRKDEIETLLSQDVERYQQINNIDENNILIFFNFFQDTNIKITITNCVELYKLSNYLQVPLLSKKIRKFIEKNNDDIEIIIQQISTEFLKTEDDNNDQNEFDLLIENLLSDRIDECFHSFLFKKLPISIIYRIVKKSAKKQNINDSLFDFIKQSIEEFYVLLSLIDIHSLSADKLYDFYNYFIEDENKEKYLQYLPINMKYIKKSKEQEDKIKKYQQILNEKDMAIQKLKLELSEMEVENQITKDFNEMKNENKNLKSQYIEIKNENQSIKSQFSKVKNENRINKSKISEMESENQKLKSQFNEVQSENQILKLQLSKIQSEKQTKDSQFSGIQSEIQVIKSQFNEISIENRHIKLQFNELQNENKYLKLQLSKIQSENQINNPQFNDIQNENQYLKSQFNEILIENRHIKSQFNELQNENKYLKLQLNKIQSENQISNPQFNDIQNENQYLKSQYNELQSENQYLKLQLSKIHNKNQIIKSQLIEIQSEIPNQKLQFNETQSIQSQLNTTQSSNHNLTNQLNESQDKTQQNLYLQQYNYIQTKSPQNQSNSMMPPPKTNPNIRLQMTDYVASTLIEHKNYIVSLLQNHPETKTDCNNVVNEFKKFKENIQKYINNPQIDSYFKTFYDFSTITPYDTERANSLISILNLIALYIHT